mgnify:CR=1 FL=1
MLKRQEAVWKVSALNYEIKTMLEKGIGFIWIEGEISNFSRPASGHWYFSLKDESAQLRAAMFKNRNKNVKFVPENGQKVLIRAQVTLYQARGEFQVIVDHMEEAGAGLLMRRFEELKQKLLTEGLFSQEHKKIIPDKAKHIGIITSASGAAIRDALSVIQRRSPSTEVTVFPSLVQGEQAASGIIKAIASANRFSKCDVLLLIRGGGSIEDLWSFNEESVARAVFDSHTPIVSGIGHETDFTIIDFVADARAPTPSVAAEMVTTDQYELMSQIDLLHARLTREMSHILSSKSQYVGKITEQIYSYHPRHQMNSFKQRLEFSHSKLTYLARNNLQLKIQQFQLASDAVKHNNPINQMRLLSEHVNHLSHQNLSFIKNRINQSHYQFTLQARSLDNLSPLKTLSRGYAVVRKNDHTIQSADELKPKDDVKLVFKDGEKQARII